PTVRSMIALRSITVKIAWRSAVSFNHLFSRLRSMCSQFGPLLRLKFTPGRVPQNPEANLSKDGVVVPVLLWVGTSVTETSGTCSEILYGPPDQVGAF